jgi:hypothetical protein
MSQPLPRPAPYANDPFMITWAESVCRDLEQRIARLVIALNLLPNGRTEFMPSLETLPAPDPKELQPHEQRAWDELRGLVFLRDAMVKRCIDRMGVVTTGEVLLDIEEELIQRGFPPGADGLDVHALLNVKPKTQAS